MGLCCTTFEASFGLTPTNTTTSDLLEVRYATSLEDGTFLDASGMSKPGTAGDSTLYFVLGEQVAGTGASTGVIYGCPLSSILPPIPTVAHILTLHHTIQFKQTVPKGWDLSLVGACVGEQREVRVPPVLAYGEKGMKKRGIPPNSVIVYNVEIVGINGNNIPR